MGVKAILADPRMFVYAQVAGTLAIMFLGITAAIALVIGFMWLVAQVLILALESVLQALHTVSLLYTTSGPFIQFCLLMALSFAIYQAGKRILAGRAK